MTTLEDQFGEIQAKASANRPISIPRPFDILLRLSHRHFGSDQDLARYFAEKAMATTTLPSLLEVDRLENSLRTVWATLDRPSARSDFLDLICFYGESLRSKLDNFDFHHWEATILRDELSGVRYSNLKKLALSYRAPQLQGLAFERLATKTDRRFLPLLRTACLAALEIILRMGKILWRYRPSFYDIRTITLRIGKRLWRYRPSFYDIHTITSMLANVTIYRSPQLYSRGRHQKVAFVAILLSGLTAAILSASYYLRGAETQVKSATVEPESTGGTDTGDSHIMSPLQGVVSYMIFIAITTPAFFIMRLATFSLVYLLPTEFQSSWDDSGSRWDVLRRGIRRTIKTAYFTWEATCVGIAAAYLILLQIYGSLGLKGKNAQLLDGPGSEADSFS